jgi:hypothetical protein
MAGEALRDYLKMWTHCINTVRVNAIRNAQIRQTYRFEAIERGNLVVKKLFGSEL